ncbi:hypothetical protein [Streptomyces sp. NPDC053431]|uniref:hypothetical protein n=1 Tax=Streptomyces sp. NPDC053431 TaxID=3365703 RepID=UPI0037D0F4D8
MREPAATRDDLSGHSEEAEEAGERRRGWLPFLAMTAAACLLAASGAVWLFWDDLMYPVGDPRACEGSDTALPGVIAPGGVELPPDASQVRYHTHEGRAVVSFVSEQVPDFLLRAGLVPDTAPPILDRSHGTAYGLGDDERELPEGLCGEGVRGPAWILSGPGTGDVLLEISPDDRYALRTPTRVQVTFRLGTAGG